MRHITLPIGLLLLVAITAQSEPKTLVVPADYQTIMGAIEAAAPGDTVLVKPGQYQEVLLIDKAITLKGEAPEQVRVRNSVDAGDIITVKSNDTVLMENLTLEHSDQTSVARREFRPNLLVISRGNVKAKKCAFQRSAGCGVLVKSGGQAVLDNCSALKCAMAGFSVSDENSFARFVKCTSAINGGAGFQCVKLGSCEVLECNARWNSDCGIYYSHKSGIEGKICDNQCDENDGAGIHVCQNATVLLESNFASNNQRQGILVETGGQAKLKRNRCEDNMCAGIRITGILSQAELQRNIVAGNRGVGIDVTFGAKARIVENVSSDNVMSGISAANWETSAEIIENTCNNSQTRHGIAVTEGAQATVRENTCLNNSGYGVLVTDEGTHGNLDTNASRGNGKEDKDPAPSLLIERQNQVDAHSVGWALAAGQFDYLDGLASRLRANKCRNSQGAFQQNTFYHEISNGYENLEPLDNDSYTKQLQEWCDQKPESSTAHIALAHAFIRRAWEESGNAGDSIADNKDMNGFDQYLHEAENVLKEAETMSHNDVVLYSVWLTVGMGLSYDNKQEEALLLKGVAIDAGYYPMYANMAYYLEQKETDHSDALRGFFSRAHELSKKEIGDTAYALLVAKYLKEFNCQELVGGSLADWNIVESGFRQLLEQFPSSIYCINSFCNTACWFKKREIAAGLFEKIGDKLDKSLWDNPGGSFNTMRQWALEKDMPHPCDSQLNMPVGLPSAGLRKSE